MLAEKGRFRQQGRLGLSGHNAVGMDLSHASPDWQVSESKAFTVWDAPNSGHGSAQDGPRVFRIRWLPARLGD